MAELLAVLGGVAAFTQLLHYGCASIGTTSALSHKVRHAADKIDAWVNHSSIIIKLLDDVGKTALSHNPNAIRMLEQCRKDAASLQSLLHQHQSDSLSKRRSKVSESVFVVLREEQVEYIMASFRNNFTILASYCAM
jgi:hypothetical protein